MNYKETKAELKVTKNYLNLFIGISSLLAIGAVMLAFEVLALRDVIAGVM